MLMTNINAEFGATVYWFSQQLLAYFPLTKNIMNSHAVQNLRDDKPILRPDNNDKIRLGTLYLRCGYYHSSKKNHDIAHYFND